MVSLVPREELVHYGVGHLLEACRERGFEVRHQPVVDQKALSAGDMARLVDWIGGRLESGGRILISCVGGLGRSGTVAACCLKSRGLDADQALAEVRRARGPRTVESRVQEEFVRAYEHPAG